MLHSVDWYIIKDVSKDRSAFILRAKQFKKSLAVGCLTLKTKVLKSFQKVAINYHKTLCKIPEDLNLRRPRLCAVGRQVPTIPRNVCLHLQGSVSRDSVVGIATRYGLDGPGVESRWGRFSAPVQTGPGAHPVSYTMSTRSLSRR
jgi:hypothetical protein